jgi:SAM-dependent methyltransferase
MDADYAQRYRELYERHWWWRARERLIVALLRSLAPAEGWRTILDVGCGDGLFFDRLDEFGDVEGIESDWSLVQHDGRWASRIRIQPFDQTFQPGQRYSLITMLDVLEHLPDASLALRRAAGLLEPDGVLVVTVPAFQALWTSHDDLNHHVRRFTRSTLIHLAREAGFDPVTSRYFFFWTCPMKLLIGLKERMLGRPSAAPSVPPVILNRALFALSLVEQETLGRLPMPFGSSLLLVGRPTRSRAL